MKKLIVLIFLCMLCSLPAIAQEKNSTVFIDKKGVMRWTDSKEETSFFGVNYTLPFAHAYRAINYLGKDHKSAIDKDVYHFARLGFNAYRIHIWEVEISDSTGNLLKNEHLDLLDYLIFKLKERNIKIVITAMTTFGNGYPERNQPTGGFSYLYDKCDVHKNPEAIKAQQNYISGLVKHVNPYTGKSYMEDPDIVGFEINNEPCHSGTPKETADYIKSMLSSLKKAGNRKPVFYNVSHNMDHIEAYYSTNIQGVTFQWYPIGLVAGQTRKGNFLPYIDDFHIPFANVKGFGSKSMLIYEYDPADITYSYMHPAMVRSFRKAGFQWITQFSYDPLDMARYNTEYQTHFLNLAYTPQKALSMKIAAEVAYSVPRNHSYGTYPDNTVFDKFRVSYEQDLSELNSETKFYYSNNTNSQPISPQTLKSVAGYGNSPVVKYEGTGAYFLDKLEEGVWRLEIMPDAVQIKDPFAKPNLKKEVVAIINNSWDMRINLPDLGNHFHISGLNDGNRLKSSIQNGVILQIVPGAYLLQRDKVVPKKEWGKESRFENITLGEYIAPQPHIKSYEVVHTSNKTTESGKPYKIEAIIAGPEQPDSVIIYTDRISFWQSNNPYYKMERIDGYTYRAELPPSVINEGLLRYNILVCRGDARYTFPAGVIGSPLDWDYTDYKYWETSVVSPESAIRLFSPKNNQETISSYAIPERYWLQQERRISEPPAENTLRFLTPESKENVTYFLRKYIADNIAGREERLKKSSSICLNIQNAPSIMHIGFITKKGYTYKATFTPKEGINKIALDELKQCATVLLPHGYPIFLKKYFEPSQFTSFANEDIETLEISFDTEAGKSLKFEIGTIWIE